MSLGISPTPASSFPSPPHVSGSLPRGGGILLNKSPEDAARRRISEPTSPVIIEPPSGPSSPVHEKPAPLLSPLDTSAQGIGGGAQSAGGGGGTTPRIRFAPLPDPTRPRSSSTGTDPAWTGNTDGSGDGHHQTVVVTDVKGYDNALESEDDDDDDESREKRGRRWSKSMSMGMGSVDWGSGWKGTKKILTMGLMGDEEEGYSNGAPLKKSVSTGGFIGSSPFRWTAETERKKNMLGTSPGSASGSSFLSPRGDSPAHRRGSSLEASGQLGTSPAKPVKMLNGRVYGGRRASEAAEAEKRRRESNEPEFVEWGAGKSGGGMGSNQPAKRSDSVDDDDGSGMEWVRKRRQRREQEEKERREREARESAESGGESDTQQPPQQSQAGAGKNARPALSVSSASSDQSPEGNRSPVTPALKLTDLPPTPIIQVSEHLSPSISAPSHPGGPLTPIAEVQGLGSKPTTPIGISPLSMRRPEQEHDVFDEDDEEDDKKRNRNGRRSSDEDGESDSDEEEEEDDGDFSEDEDEEEEFRTTSSAAGIEKISRHRDQSQPSTPAFEQPPVNPMTSALT